MSAPRVAVIATVLLVGLPAAVGALAPHASLALVSPLPSASLPVPLPSASLPVPLPSASLPPLPSASLSPLPSASLPVPSPSLGVPSIPPLPGSSIPALPSASLGGLPSLSPLGSASPVATATDEAGGTDADDQPGAGAGGDDNDGGLGSAFQALNDLLEIGLPALAIGIPLLLALGVLGAQLVGGASLMPVVRRTLGGLGLRRFAPPTDGPAVPVSPASDPPGRRA